MASSSSGAKSVTINEAAQSDHRTMLAADETELEKSAVISNHNPAFAPVSVVIVAPTPTSMSPGGINSIL